MFCLQVYERRKAPPGFEAVLESDTDQQGSNNSKKNSKNSNKQADTSTGNADQVTDLELGAGRVGGGVRLEMNGLKAIAAISRDLAGRVVSEGLYAHKVLLHDTIGERGSAHSVLSMRSESCSGMKPRVRGRVCTHGGAVMMTH